MFSITLSSCSVFEQLNRSRDCVYFFSVASVDKSTMKYVKASGSPVIQAEVYRFDFLHDKDYYF